MLVEQLAKVGVKVKIEQIEWGQWLERVYKNADYDMTIIGHAEAWDTGTTPTRSTTSATTARASRRSSGSPR